MEKKNCYASLGTLLLLRVAVAASLVACVWAHREDSDDHDHHHHHHNHDHDRGEERGSLVITILVSVRKADCTTMPYFYLSVCLYAWYDIQTNSL